jgi:hypothetical protein
MCDRLWQLHWTRLARLEAHNRTLRRRLREAEVMARVWQKSAEHRATETDQDQAS